MTSPRRNVNRWNDGGSAGREYARSYERRNATPSRTPASTPKPVQTLARDFRCTAGDGIACAKLLEFNSSRNSSSATFTSAMVCQRRSGSFFKHRAMIRSSSCGISATACEAGWGSLKSTAESDDNFDPPEKARWPVAISYTTDPNEKTSERLSTFLPSACSGDM